MNDVQKSWLTASGIAVCVLGVYGGSQLRDSVDMRGAILADRSSPVVSTWVASRDTKVEIPAVDYYNQMVGLLKQYYVQPISNDQKLAVGAVRGMVASLGDSQSLFMDPTEFHAFMNRQKGIYEGIGVDLYLAPFDKKPATKGLVPPPEDAEEAVATIKVPRVVVGGVVPGSPADKAGIAVGDFISDIDGHWVIDQELIDKFRHMQGLFNQKKMTYAQIEPFQREIRSKTERALLPIKAMDRLLLGNSGSVQLQWVHGGQSKSATVDKVETQMPGFTDASGVVRLPISQTSVDSLSSALAGKRSVTIDLRNSPEGDYEAVPALLAELAPAGTYGSVEADRNDFPESFSTTKGNQHPPELTLLVDKSTRGPAEILAISLSSHGKATLKGSLTGGDLALKQYVALPDGSGYTLVTGKYRSYPPTPKQGAKQAKSGANPDPKYAFAAAAVHGDRIR
jgi:carboxyl-terminal processing protease